MVLIVLIILQSILQNYVSLNNNFYRTTRFLDIRLFDYGPIKVRAHYAYLLNYKDHYNFVFYEFKYDIGT